jgi:hypothetical protein
VNDGLLIEVIHGGHDAILEFLFGCDADMTQDGAGEFGLASALRLSLPASPRPLAGACGRIAKRFRSPPIYRCANLSSPLSNLGGTPPGPAGGKRPIFLAKDPPIAR